MNKVRSIAFAFATSAFLAGVIAYLALGAVGVLNVAEKSVLEGRAYEEVPDVTPMAVLKSDFQDALEAYLGDHVPNRDTVLLTNAKLDLTLISCANAPFGFAGYSTFYGSDHVYLPQYEAVVEKPSTQSEKSDEKLKKATKTYRSFIERHESINWAFCMPDRSNTTLASPLHDLVSKPADYGYYRKGITDNLQDLCTVVDASYDDAESFFASYFHTDHHWQIEGALRAYGGIMEALGKTPLEFGAAETVFGGPFWGANARSGLCTEGRGDTVRDVTISQPNLRVWLGSEEKSRAFIDEGLGDDPDSFTLSDTFGSAYAQWFHHAEKEVITIENDSVESGTLLIVGDSFANDLDRVFAQSYHTVYHIDPRYDTVDIDEFIETHDIDDGLILLNQSFITSKDVMDSLK